MLQDMFPDLHLIRNKLERWYVFFCLDFLTFEKIKSIGETF